eukprot:6481686-Pyramimonas_sp.AAC.1
MERSMIILPVMRFFPWLVMCVMGGVARCWCWRKSGAALLLLGANDYGSEVDVQSGRSMRHLDDDDRVVHLERSCKYLQGAHDVGRRLKQRRMCKECSKKLQ